MTEAKHLTCKCGYTKFFPAIGYHGATSLTCDKCGYSVGLFQSNWPPAKQERPTEAPETSETPSGYLRWRRHPRNPDEPARLQQMWYLTEYRGLEVSQKEEWRDVPYASD